MANKKRILIDTYHLFVAQTGAGRYIRDVVKWVESEDLKEHEYILFPSNIHRLTSPNYRRRSFKLFRIIAQLELLIWKQLIIPMKAWWIKPDLLFSPDYYAPFTPLPCKKVTVFYDTFFWDSPEHYGQLWLKYFNYVLRKGIGKSGDILTISSFSQKRIIDRLGVSEGSVRSIHLPFVPVEMNDQLTDLNWFDEIGLTKTKYFLHVGVFEKRKQLPFLVKAFERWTRQGEIKDMKLVLIGKKAPNQRFDDFDNVMRLVEKYNLEDKVIFPGFVSNEQLEILYKEAFAYILPSTNEGFGLPVLEAFARDCPLIISSQGAIVEVAGGAALVFEMLNTQELIDEMDQVYTNEDLRNELARKGQERLGHFTQAQYFNTFEAYLTEIMSKMPND